MYRDFITAAVVIDRADVFPDNWIYVSDPGVKMGRIQNFKNWSADMVPDPLRQASSSGSAACDRRRHVAQSALLPLFLSAARRVVRGESLRVWLLRFVEDLCNGVSFAVGTVLFIAARHLGLRLPGGLPMEPWIESVPRVSPPLLSPSPAASARARE